MRLFFKIFAFLALSSAALAQTYSYVQFDVPNSSQTRPFGINTSGQIVGLTRDGDGTPHAFLRYTDGTYLKFDYPGAVFTNASGINDMGEIVGRWTDKQNKNHTYFRSAAGVFANFDPPLPCSPGKDQTFARAINNHRDIAGRCFSNNHHEYAWIRYSDGTFQILNDPSFASADAYFVTNGGQTLAGGDYDDGTGVVHGVLWNRDGGFTTVDVLSSQATSIHSMNSAGDLAGIYHDAAAGRGFGFLLRDGVVTTIDFPNSSDESNAVINDNGVIVGGFFDVAGAEHGFIATCSGPGC